MFDFHFIYANDDMYAVYNVTGVSIYTEGGLEEIPKENIYKSNIPFRTLYLHSTNGNYIVPVNEVRAIEITERKVDSV